MCSRVHFLHPVKNTGIMLCYLVSKNETNENNKSIRRVVYEIAQKRLHEIKKQNVVMIVICIT